MKTNRIISLLTAIFVIALSGCNKQKDPTVRLQNDMFITTDILIAPGDPLQFKWLAEKGKSDLSSFTILLNGNDWYGYPVDTIPPDTYYDSAYLEGPAAQGHYAFSFIVTDTEGKIGEQAVLISVE
jgi:hypothetical protein